MVPRTRSSNSTLWLAELTSVSIISKTRREASCSTARTCWPCVLVYQSIWAVTPAYWRSKRTTAVCALLVRIVGHVVVFLQNGVDTIVCDREAVPNAQYVGDGHCARAEALAQFEHAVFEVFEILRIGGATGNLRLWDVTAVAVLFGESLDATAANLEPVSDQPGVEIVINNPLIDPDDIVLIKFHFIWLLVGEITPTKPLADTTTKEQPRTIQKGTVSHG